jgi:predicted phage terminase large subunit-like protein
MMPSFSNAPHAKKIIEHLVALEAGEIQRLILSTPPQHGKSTAVSQLFPAWYAGRNPEQPVVLASYSQELADRNSRIVRGFVGDQRFPFPVHISDTSRAVNRWSLREHRGSVLAVGIDSHLTGFSAQLLVCDDLIADYADAKSPTQRQAVWDWWTTVALTRLARDHRIILAGTRWHDDDLTGRILNSDDAKNWTVLNLPALSRGPEVDPLGRPEGAALWPAFKDEADLAALRTVLGPQKFSALYMGSPIPDGGTYFQASWFEHEYDELPRGLSKFFTMDTALKTGVSNDYSVLLVAATDGRNVYIVDVIRRKLEYPRLRSLVVGEFERHFPSRVYIVSSDNGINLLADLRSTTRMPLIAMPPGRDSKEARVEAITGYWEAGRVLLPRNAVWKADFIAEHLRFPAVPHDDQVDAAELAVRQLRDIEVASHRRRGYFGPLSTILAAQRRNSHPGLILP